MKAITPIKRRLLALPVIAFVLNYWLLLLALYGASLLATYEPIFTKYGTLAFVPVFVIGAVVLSKLIGHLIFRETIDKDVCSGTFVSDWRSMPPERRATLAIYIMIGFYIGACIVTSGLAK